MQQTQNKKAKKNDSVRKDVAYDFSDKKLIGRPLNMKVNPVKFAQELVDRQGIDAAERIVADCGREGIGKDGKEPNPHRKFYSEVAREVARQKAIRKAKR
jgi:hypothetical protein